MLRKTFLVFFVLVCSLDAFIKDFGTEEIVDYTKYGYFENLGTNDYIYIIRDKKSLIEAQGEGVYPNHWIFFSDQRFLDLEKQGQLEGSRWSFINLNNPELSYYKWSISFQEEPGIRQFYIARALEDAGYIKQAIKAYYSILIFFPKTRVNTYFNLPLYLSDIAKDRILYLLSHNLDIKWSLKDVNIKIQNKFDNDLSNDVFHINPGQIINDENIETAAVKRQDLVVDDQKYFIKGVFYSPIPVGKVCSNFTEKNQVLINDFNLMKEMGVNTCISNQLNQKLLKFLSDKYNIKSIVCISDFDENIINIQKDQKYLLFWMIKIENLSDFKKANELAKKIKQLDPNHLVALSNKDLLNLDLISRDCENIDLLGVEAFRGDIGLGDSFWSDLREYWKKPVFISSYGASAYTLNQNIQNAEDFQLDQHKKYWQSISNNANKQCVGGVVCEWVDQWWKSDNASFHDKISIWQGPILNLFLYNEWLGIVAQDNNKRTKRKVFFFYKQVWN